MSILGFTTDSFYTQVLISLNIPLLKGDEIHGINWYPSQLSLHILNSSSLKLHIITFAMWVGLIQCYRISI